MIGQGTGRRKYIRISTVLPVEFIVLDEQEKQLTPWLQGFTCDIGRGGIGLLINDLWQGFWNRFNYQDALLSLKINLPFRTKSISVKAKVVWSEQLKDEDFDRCVIGVEFIETEKKPAGKLLFKYAVYKKCLPFIVTGFLALLILMSIRLFCKTDALIKQNRRQVADYVKSLEHSSFLQDSLKDAQELQLRFQDKQSDLEKEITSLEEEVIHWQKDYMQLKEIKDKNEEASKEGRQLEEKINLLEKEIAVLKQENDVLKTKREHREDETIRIQEEVNALERERYAFSQDIIKGMFEWIKNRQDLISGVVLSYEGDRSLEKISFTYDQSLAVIVFLVFNDLKKAEKILDFYLGIVENDDNIYNAYYSHGAVAEYVVHSGPNAWIGIAALNYIKKTGNKKYFPIAETVDAFLTKMRDKEGGIRGGSNVGWYSTEHNLDAVAFYNLFYEVTGKKKYLDAAKTIEKWVSQYSYTDYSVPIKRGKGDSTVATDTYAWSITAFGPQALLAMNMNPDAILEFAIEHCEVEALFEYRGEEVKLKGFDFAKARNLARGGIVSGEWTAQMILAFEIMSDFYKNKNPDKQNEYITRAVFYFNELQKMLITSPSRIGREEPCLPYASKASVDTGHGWYTPEGNTTGSLSATAYFLIAYYGFNPLTGKYLDFSIKDFYEKKYSGFITDFN